MKSFQGTLRGAPSAAISTMSASNAASVGRASPAGEQVPRLPPTVPRLRICGEPTVRAACRSGTSPGSSRMIRLYVIPAPRKISPSSCRHSSNSGIRETSRISSGRPRSKFSSTMRSVPPAIGTACGCAALSSRASLSVRGSRTSISTCRPRRRRSWPSHRPPADRGSGTYTPPRRTPAPWPGTPPAFPRPRSSARRRPGPAASLS